MTGALLEAKNLEASFPLPEGRLKAVDGLSLSVRPGEVVGESGCGKSVFAQTVPRLLEQSAEVLYKGEITFRSKEILKAPLNEARKLRGKEIGLVFQDSVTALHPLMTIGDQMREPLGIHLGLGKLKANERAMALFERCGLPNPALRLKQHPHELSGGMCQRVMIAMAISCDPKLLIADEPTTALDMSAQSKVLKLFRDISSDGAAVVLISHDLGAVGQVCDKVAVMYLGHLVEEGPAAEVLTRPAHPNTRALLAARPKLSGEKARELPTIPGQAARTSSACRFAPRCPLAKAKCHETEPPVLGEDRKARCFCPLESLKGASR
jgi:peptide/nickel transport system ATP-binding protein